MARYIVVATKLNDDDTVFSVSRPIIVDSDTVNEIQVFDKTYAQVKHGWWEFIGATTRGVAIINIYACSECGYEADTTNYCPNCGTKMDGGEK